MKIFFRQVLILTVILSYVEIYTKRYVTKADIAASLLSQSLVNQSLEINKKRKFLSAETVKDNINLIVILCPPLPTGGPEDLAQLYFELKQLGFEIYFLWINELCEIKIKHDNGIAYLCKDDNKICATYVKKYEVNNLTRDIPLIDTTLIITPEIWADSIYLFDKAQTAIYWLSIGFFGGPDTQSIFRLMQYQRIKDLHCLHFVTCPYASKFLKKWEINSIELGQYISTSYFSKAIVSKIDNSIAFFPRKARELGEKFVYQYPGLNYIRLENLDEQGVINALDSAKIYIDFGFFPGPERVPREALLRDCIIFIRNVGAATDYDTYPIDDYFRFSDSDVTDGTLYRKVCETLADYENMKKKQDYKRDITRNEHSIFQQRVKNVFGVPCNK